MVISKLDEQLALGRGASPDYNQNETFLDPFLRQVAKNPNARAVLDEFGPITYRELDIRSNYIASELLKKGVREGDFVAVKLPRIKEFLVAVIGVWKAGCAYMPVDPGYPEERIQYMLEDSGAKVTVDESWMESLRYNGNDLPASVNRASVDGIAIIIYTSGSTGRPKGVLNTHRGVMSLCYNANLGYEYEENDVFAQVPSFSYVISVTDLFPPLAYGLQVFILSHSLLTNISALDRCIRENGITVITIVPQIGIPLIQKFHTPLRAIGMGGAKVEMSQPTKIKFLSAYGLTETCSAVAFVDLLDTSVGTGALLGRPTHGVTIVLEDEQGNPVSRGEIGEVCISSPQVAAGYWHNDELTAKVFVDRPWSEYKVFRSGDLARWNDAGVLEFHGRKDEMVKVRGNRVEIGEVESALLKVAGVRAGAVAMKEVHGEPMLCGYYVSSEPLTQESVSASMSEFLPPYMIPSFFIRLDTLPKLPNGKLDKLSLPAPDTSDTSGVIAPESEFEKLVCPVVIREFGIDSIGVTTNLISMGLTSLLAIKLSAALKTELGIVISQSDMLAHPVIRQWETLCSAAETIPVETVREYYPLTDNQMGVYVEWEQNHLTDQYNLPFVLKLNGGDAQKLLASVQETIKLYPILRMRVAEHDGTVAQMRRDDADLAVGFEKLDFEPDDSFFGKLVRPFNLMEEDLARFNVYSSPSAAWLFFDVHHIVFDGGSVNLFIQNLSSLYCGGTPILESVTGYDYALYRERWKETDEFGAYGDYFGRLLDETEPFTYPSSIKGMADGRVSTVTVTIPRQGVREFCRGCGVTENSFFATVLTQVFHRVSREKSIQMAMFSSGRSMTQLTGSIGMFVQTLPLVSRITGGTVRSALESIHSQIVETLSRDKYPYTVLAGKYGVKPNVMYVYQGDLIESFDFGETSAESHRLPVTASMSPLTVEILPAADEYTIHFEYDCGMYVRKDIDTLAGAVTTLATAAAKSSDDTLLSALEMVSEDEKSSLLSLGTGEKIEYDRSETFVDQFLRSVSKTPDAVAVVDENGFMTYKELDDKSNSLAASLIGQGVVKDTFVAIMLPRVKEFLVAVLGVWKAGGAYLPLGSEYPKERLKFMLEDAEAEIMITESGLWSEMSDAGLPARTVMELDQFDFGAAVKPLNNAVADGLAYMIYTSGSTGKPKGTMLEHHNLRAFNEWLILSGEIKSGDAISVHASFSFDGSCLDLYPALTVGGQVHILSKEVREDMSLMDKYFREHHIKGCFLTARLAGELLNSFDLSLEYLMAGGEKVVPFRPCGIRVMNAYGPTECTILSTCGPVDQTFPEDNIPLGRPVPNTYAVIVDSYGNMVPRGMSGELCLCGPQIARGYWKRQELTAEKFCACPFYPGEQMYHSGDIAFWNDKDELVCLGRTDDQIKLRGFRIELGEIESAMSTYPGILSAVADVRSINGVRHLCAWYVSKDDIDEASLRAFLSDYLTDYMVPESFVRMEKMPMTVNLKIDRKALPNPEMSARTYVAPENETEQAIADAFRDSLNLPEPVGRGDSFYALGGDSIKAIRVVSRLRQEGLAITVSQIIKLQTASLLAEVAEPIEEGEDSSDYFEIPALPVGESFSSPEEYESVRAEFDKRGETIERAYPLTPMQEGMLLTALSEPESSAYHITFRISLGILPTEDQMRYAIGKLLSKREVLRTAIIHKDVSEPRQAIVGGRKLPLMFADLSSESDTDAAAQAFDRQEFDRKIDLQWDPLFRCALLKTGTESCQLLFTVHHALIDGWCNALWIGDVFQYLTEAVTGNGQSEDFSDGYGRYERHVYDIISRDREAALDYWKELLAGYETKAEIPAYEKVTDDNRSSENEFKVSLTADATTRLERLCRENGCTVNNAVEAAWGLVLQAYTRTDDVVFVKVVSGRDNSQEDMSDVVGLFINSVPVRVTKEEKSTLLDLVKSCQQQASETSAHDWVPLSEIQQQSTMGSSLFQSILAFENYETGSVSSLSDDVLRVRSVCGHETNVSEIAVAAFMGGETLDLDIKFDVEKYTGVFIQRVLDCFRNIVSQIADTPMLEVSSLRWTDSEEERRLIELGTGEKLDFNRNETFIDMFLRHVSTTPDAAAVADYRSKLTYGELDAASDALAARLAADGVRPGDFVAVKIPRVKEFMVAVLSIWKAGAAYIPVDPEYPEERISYMLEDSGAKVIITPENIGELSVSGQTPVNLSRPEATAYMIYTSGSTGRPKGTEVRHSNVTAYLAWITRMLDLKPGDNLASYVSFSFDGSLSDLYPALACGCTLHILSDDLRKDLNGMNDYFIKNRVKGLDLMPQIAAEMLANFDLTLEYILAGGERVPQFRPSKVNVYNVYGPTECTNITVCGLIDQNFPFLSIPIGRPVPGTVAMIMDSHGKLLPRGMAGELYLAGEQVSKGYHNREELNSAVFMDAPYQLGGKMYKTGDLARWNENGELDCLGRIDHQVKLRGFRIELGEIEVAISKFEGIATAVADIKTVNGIQHLCAYYVSDEEIDESALKTVLSKSLTEYMIPDSFMRIEAVPFTPNGKVDRKALPLPQIKGTEYVAPANETEQTIGDVLRESLSLDNPVGREDGFYALGGDSIKAIRVVSRLRQKGLVLSVAQIIKLQTVSRLAEIAETVEEGEDQNGYFDVIEVPVAESFSSEAEFESVRAEFEKRGETIERAYPLTSMQEGMLLKALSEPESSAYHITTQFSLGVLPTEEQLNYALGKLLSKREVFRTSIVHEGVSEPRQAIISGRKMPLSFVDISSEKDIDAASREYEQQAFCRKIDLQWDPLFSCTCLKTGENSCHLLFTSHHSVMDGWCNSLWIGDFFRYLTEAVTGNEQSEDFSESYGRYSRHVRSILSRDKETALEYWNGLLAEYETKAEIPVYEKVTDNNRSGVNEIKVSIPSGTTGKLEKLCRENGCTVNNAVEAAWGLVLQAYNRTNDVVFVKVVSGRDNSQEDMSDVVGLFINSVPVRVKREENSTILDMVRFCQRQGAETSQYDWVPMAEIQQQSTMGSNLFQSIMAFENYEMGDLASSSENVLKAGFVQGHETNISEITLAAYVAEGSLTVDVKFDTAKYTDTAIGYVAKTFERILCEMASHPDSKVSEISLTDESEREELIRTGMGEKLAYDNSETFVDQFLRSLSEWPDYVALVDMYGTMTYRELDEKSNVLASSLRGLGVQKDIFVSIMLPRVNEFMVAVLGVWKAGGAYLPLGSEYPKERLKFMLEDAQAEIMITESGIWGEMADAELPARTVIKLDEFDFSAAVTPMNNAVADGLAYMIYTSGSTGRPKGTMLEHRNLRAFNEWLAKLVEMKAGDAIIEHASFSFDGSCLDLYPALTVGGKVHILNNDLRRDMPALVDYLKSNHIKGGFLTTRLSQELLNNFDLPLEYIMMGGEKNHGFRPSKIKVYEVYGPTETTILATAGLTDQSFPDIDNIPIGRPAPNLTLFITDKNGQLVPRGMAGELCIAGPQVARGYWNQPELTDRKFTVSPVCAEERMYHTGDLSRWDEDGNVIFLGRIDNQVKLRGFRIEMGEVDSALTKCPGIMEAVSHIVTVNGIQHLCAYYVSETELDENEIKSILSETLTDYMVPTSYIRMESLPLNPNGKVDYKKLPLPVIKSTEYVAPENEIEQIIADAFHDSLNLPHPVGREDGFYALGGDSIKAIRVVSRLRQDGLVITVSQIIKLQTVSKLAEVTEPVEEGEDFSEYFELVSVPVEESFSSAEEYRNVKAEFESRGETIERAYPLTPMQEGMLLTALSEPESSAYHITFRFSLGILPSEEQLSYALGKVLSKREVLRTAIVHDGVLEARQAIIGGRKLPLSFVDLSAEKDVDAAILDLDRQEFDRKIDLQHDSLLRCTCIRIGEDRCQLLFTIHHAIVDGWCSALWMGDFFKYLTESIFGKESEEDVTAGHGRYERHVRSILYRDRDAALDYWKKLLSDYETKAEIPAYEKVTEENRARENAMTVSLPAQTTSKLEVLCRENGCSMNNAVEAAWGLVLQSYNRTNDAVFVKVVSGRDNSQEDMSDVVGLFINSVPVRVTREDSSTLLDLVKKCQIQASETNAHDWVPLSQIQQQSSLGSNLFQSIIAFENFETGGATGSSLEDELKVRMVSGHETNVSEMAVAATVTGDTLELEIKFDVTKYTAVTIGRVLECFRNILSQIAESPSMKVSSLQLADMQTARELVELGTGAKLDYDWNETFVDMFLRNVSAAPESTAVVDYCSSLTYGEFDKMSDAIASRLVSDGIRPGDFVAVKMPRVKEFIVAVLGVWKAGGAYVPVDPEYPEERISYMLEDAGAKVVIDPAYCESITTDNTKPLNLSRPDNPAYMIYTSGSTGKPKGVVVTHANLRAFMAWLPSELELKPGEAVAQHASFSFDASVCDLYSSLASGAALHILSSELRKDLDGLAKYIEENRIVGSTLSTQLGMELLNAKDLKLRYMVLGGEKLKQVRKTDVRMYNGYGPTEFTVWSSHHIVNQVTDGENIPIGRPVPNSISLILDANGNVVPRGMAGELCLSGSQLSNGYWHRPELTEKVFVSCKALDGAKIYRTGDLARWNENGELEYMGRIDNQVKLRGFRIEMGEIEAALSAFAGITSAVAEVKTVNGIQHLCAYYVSDTEIDETLLESEISKSLTEYMIPDVYMRLESLPMTPGGKVDRKALPLPDLKIEEYSAPETELEKLLCGIFGEILGIAEYSATGNFFKLGGTSINCIKAVARIQENNLNVVYGDIFKYKTPRALAGFIEGKGKTENGTAQSFDYGDYDYSAVDALLQNTPSVVPSDMKLNTVQTVLVAGATGYLGIHVLCSLLENTRAQVCVLIRPQVDLTCEQRLYSVWMYYIGTTMNMYSDRIVFIEGDITDENLHNKLSGYHFDVVINCAAMVKHYVVDDSMDKVNVEGVRNLIEFCAKDGSRLIQTSTYSIGGAIPATSVQDLDERHLYIGQTSDNDYVRTKFLAERYVLEAVASGKIHGKVMRLGNLMGRGDDGEFQMNIHANAFVNMLRTYSLLGCFPESRFNETVEFSPIDQVAEAVTRLSMTPDDMPVFHPYTVHRTEMSTILAAMNKVGLKVDVVPDRQFGAAVSEMMKDKDKAANLRGILHYQSHFQSDLKGANTVNDWTAEVLKETGFVWGKTNAAYLNRFLTLLKDMMMFE